MTANMVLLDANTTKNVKYHLVYFENMAERDLLENLKARGLIWYLCGQSFMFYYQNIAKYGIHTEQHQYFDIARSEVLGEVCKEENKILTNRRRMKSSSGTVGRYPEIHTESHESQLGRSLRRKIEACFSVPSSTLFECKLVTLSLRMPRTISVV